MKVILDEKVYDEIWDKIYRDYKFHPSVDTKVIPFNFKVKYVCYKLNNYWTAEQEKLVNDIFKSLSDDDLYALEWESDCYEYNPKEEIELGYNYYDEERDCNVYFPSYYPNGDYYFFVSKDWEYGMFGHPWRKEIYLIGDKLINEFAKKEKKLGLVWYCKK